MILRELLAHWARAHFPLIVAGAIGGSWIAAYLTGQRPDATSFLPAALLVVACSLGGLLAGYVLFLVSRLRRRRRRAAMPPGALHREAFAHVEIRGFGPLSPDRFSATLVDADGDVLAAFRAPIAREITLAEGLPWPPEDRWRAAVRAGSGHLLGTVGQPWGELRFGDGEPERVPAWLREVRLEPGSNRHNPYGRGPTEVTDA